MYITNIKLESIRCYKEVNIKLDKENGAHSLMIAGNNGSGKSAVLRAIAMGLCDQASAGSLLRELLGDFIQKEVGKKNKRRTATITIDLKDHDGIEGYQIKTKLKINDEIGFEVVNQVLNTPEEKNVEQEDFPFNKIFVTAYGAGLRTEGTEDYGQYFAADAVYSLFKYSQPLQNPEISWRRICEVAEDSSKADEKIKEKLLKILNLINEKNSVTLENNGLFVKADWGNHELSALGDGYRALTNILMDICSWLLLMKNHDVILEELDDNIERKWESLDLDEEHEGIVIIDEIEKHLHPKLQRLVVSRLKEIFPKIQFILSSHSPLCVAGTADIKDDPNIDDEFKIYITRSNEDKEVEAVIWNDATDGMRTDQILESIFDVPYIDQTTVNKLRKFSALYLDKENLGDEEETELKNLRSELSANSANTFLKLESKLIDTIIEESIEMKK